MLVLIGIYTYCLSHVLFLEFKSGTPYLFKAKIEEGSYTILWESCVRIRLGGTKMPRRMRQYFRVTNIN
jgi:hypothetical protein